MGGVEVHVHSLLTSTRDGGVLSYTPKREFPVAIDQKSALDLEMVSTFWSKDESLASAENRTTILRMANTQYAHFLSTSIWYIKGCI